MNTTKQHHETLPAADWESYFQKARVRVEELANCKSERSKSIRIGRFLSPMVGRKVPIQQQERTGTAELRVVECRGGEKRYGFIIKWDKSDSSESENNNNSVSSSDVVSTLRTANLNDVKTQSDKSIKRGIAVRKPATKTPERTAPTAVQENKKPAEPTTAGGGGNDETW